ncbi:hypothetical protein INT47_003092 [Mucor saturninus]|uniref:RNA helicase n=1 Tax=Mucor saturninus TaxID=64648 RepID=A0A8H7V0X1_9FUNG|nr:hypothetical protein INT47_003092 [Mucor saturninus]
MGWGTAPEQETKPPLSTYHIRLYDLVNDSEMAEKSDPNPSTSIQSSMNPHQGVFDQRQSFQSTFDTEKMRQFEMEVGNSFSASGPGPSSSEALNPTVVPVVLSKVNYKEEKEAPIYERSFHVKLFGADNQEAPVVHAFDQIKGMHPDILKSLYSMRFIKPSNIQSQAIPLILAEPFRNLIAQSQSGTGKTAAFAIASLLRIDPNLNHTQVICISPSRELSRQIQYVISEISQFTNHTSTLLVKDAFKNKNDPNNHSPHKLLTDHIVVGTPGIILDTLRRKKVIDTTHIKLFILDEADNMLDQDGLGDQSIRIKNLIGGDPQILLFSATFPDHVYQFAHRFAPDPNEITLRVEELSVSAIKQFYMDCHDEDHKYSVLTSLYDFLTLSQTMIFCKRRDTADEITLRMKNLGHSVGCIHGSMTSVERDTIIHDFRCMKFKVLISTNLVSRGIDISMVSLVVNYDMPLDKQGHPDAEVYLHRIGRTGRFGRTGLSIVFVHDQKT